MAGEKGSGKRFFQRFLNNDFQMENLDHLGRKVLLEEKENEEFKVILEKMEM